MKEICLSELPLRHSGEVIKISCEERFKNRLNELGIYEGAIITPVLKSPFGEPRAYCASDSVTALRNSDCDMIMVRAL